MIDQIYKDQGSNLESCCVFLLPFATKKMPILFPQTECLLFRSCLFDPKTKQNVNAPTTVYVSLLQGISSVYLVTTIGKFPL